MKNEIEEKAKELTALKKEAANKKMECEGFKQVLK